MLACMHDKLVSVRLHTQDSGKQVVALVFPSSSGGRQHGGIPIPPISLSPEQARSLAQALVDTAFIVEEHIAGAGRLH